MYVLSLNHVIHTALTFATLACYVSAVICVADDSLNALTTRHQLRPVSDACAAE